MDLQFVRRRALITCNGSGIKNYSVNLLPVAYLPGANSLEVFPFSTCVFGSYTEVPCEFRALQ